MTIRRTLTLLVGGLTLCALAATSASARGKAGAKTVNRTISAKTAYDYWRFHKLTNFASMMIIDLRSRKQFVRGRIPGAKNIEATKRIRAKLNKLNRKKAYMLYCRNGKVGKKTMALMKKLHFKKVYNIADGIIAWKRRKFPLKRGTGED